MIKNAKIMVIEKDPVVKNFIVDVLEFSINREVLSFDMGLDALNYIVENGRVDIVLCATDVPGVSGVDLISTVKSRWPQITCIAISDQAGDNIPPKSTMIDSFITRPVDTKDLFDIVQKFVVEGQPY